jgi:phosphotriesterase-related protein
VDDEELLPLILKVIEAGKGSQLLLSHDRGWFNPANQPGEAPKPYTHLSLSMLPKLRAAGVDEGTITMLTHENPFNAFAR